MESTRTQTTPLDEVKPSFSLGGFALIMAGAFLGALAAALVLPKWLPGLTSSLTAAEPKAFWFLARSSAFIAYFLLWLSMVLGVGITNKLAALWPGLPPTNEIHQYTSILGLAFGLFHGLIILGDKYIGFTLAQVLLPFTTSNYKPFAVGLGQLGFYLMLILTFSFYVRKKIGYKVWRAIHFLSFLSYISVLIHSLMAGTDSTFPVVQYFSLITGGLVLFMILFRILASRANAREKKLRVQRVPPRIPNA